jgi:hypothetical protein
MDMGDLWVVLGYVRYKLLEVFNLNGDTTTM